MRLHPMRIAASTRASPPRSRRSWASGASSSSTCASSTPSRSSRRQGHRGPTLVLIAAPWPVTGSSITPRSTSAEPREGMLRITRIGGPTAFIEWSGWRILTDPTFDPPGRTYAFGAGTRFVEGDRPRRTARGARTSIDAGLLPQPSRPRRQPRRRRPKALSEPRRTVLTTRGGGEEHSHPHPDLRGLAAGDVRHPFGAGVSRMLTITATPGRHGAPLHASARRSRDRVRLDPRRRHASRALDDG